MVARGDCSLTVIAQNDDQAATQENHTLNVTFLVWENGGKLGPDELQSSRDLPRPLETPSESTGGIQKVQNGP